MFEIRPNCECCDRDIAVDDPVVEAYARRAQEYLEAVGKIEHAAAVDREAVLEWARGVDGPVLDVGCGPGQWTAYLAQCGIDVEGVDPVAEFVAGARIRHPSVSYRVGRAEHLEVADRSLGGILAWYSLIHTPAGDIDAALREFARALKPGGSVLLGFFAGPNFARFEHAVAPAYYWPVADIAGRLEQAGFEILRTETRQDPGVRAHGSIAARLTE
jgi:ubiquinone/menaquinone biosynthesis C-methylase UbiE